VRASVSVDAASYILLPISNFVRMKVSREKQSFQGLPRVSDLILALACWILALACWLVLLLLFWHQQARHHPSGVASADARYGHPFGAAHARAHRGIALGVYKPVGSTPPLLTLQGSWKELIADDGQRVALC
jgi:hypothetical protein